MKLGKREIDGLTCPAGKKDILVADDALRGFFVRVTSAGTKAFLFQYRAGKAGPVRRLQLGTYGQVTPAEARKLAEIARGEVNAGRDPVMEKRGREKAAAEGREAERERAVADAFTLRKLIEEWETKGLAGNRPSYRSEAVRCLLVNVPELVDKPARSITGIEAMRAVDRVERDRGGPIARRTLAYGRAMYNWAAGRHILTANPFAGLAAPGRESSRDRALSDAELGEVWRAIEALGPPFAPCLKVLVLTLQRREEVAGLRRSELDNDRGIWTIPAARAKNGRAHEVHLVDACRDILRACPRIDGSDLVFTTTGGTPLSGFSRAKARIDAAVAEARARAAGAGRKPDPMPGWVFHDFRRTGVTTLARLGFAPHVCDKLLNHVSGSLKGTAATYQRFDFMPDREAALKAWAAHVLLVGAPQPAERGGPAAAQGIVTTAERRRPRR